MIPKSLTQILLITTIVFAFVGQPRGYAQAELQPDKIEPESNFQEVVKLPAFRVTEQPTNRFNAGSSASAARTAGALLDSGVTINVITPAMVRDINPSSLLDVTRYFSGVSPGRSSGVAGVSDRQVFRGFESFSRTADNFSHAMMPIGVAPFNSFAPVFIDHAELIMGPNTILSPTGTPGGTINVITKSPKFTQGTDISATVGNYNSNIISVDTTGPLGDGKRMAYRIIGSYQDSKNYTPGDHILGAGSIQFTYSFSHTAELTVKYFGSQNTLTGAASMVGLSGNQVFTSDTVRGATLSSTPQPGFVYRGWNGQADWSEMTVRDHVAQAELTAALGDRIKMRLAGQVYYSMQNRIAAWPIPPIIATFDPNTGEQIAVAPINTSALPINASIFRLKSRQIQFQNDYAGKFQYGPVTLEPVVGWSYQSGSAPINFQVSNRSLPVANLADGFYSPPVPAKSSFTISSFNAPQDGWTMQAYGYVRAGIFKDRVFVTGGAARTWAGVNIYALPNVITSDGINAGTPGPTTRRTFSNTLNPLSPSVQPWNDSYIGGLLYKMAPNVSVYYNYSTNASLAQSLPLWQEGKQHEFGIKSSFFGKRLSVNANYFNINQANVAAQNPLFNTSQSMIRTIFTDLSSHGFELNVIGGLTKELSVIASYTNQKLRDFVDRRQRNIPDYLANLLLNYDFKSGALKETNIFLGVHHQGNVAGETIAGFTPTGVPQQPGYYLAPYTVVNAGASHTRGNYRFNLNIDNVLDKKFWWQAGSRSTVASYPGITVRLTVNRHF